jgi:hypothetical protein
VTPPLGLETQELLRKPSGRLTAQSEPENVEGSVKIAIKHNSTMDARMGALTEVFVWPFALTGAAPLAGLVGVHKHDADMPGALSLGTHHRDERCPPSILYRLVEPTFGGCPIGQELARFGILFWFGTPAHVLGLEVFKDNRLVTVDQVARLFVQKVLALVAHMTMAPAHLLRRFTASVAAALLVGKCLLSSGQLFLGCTQVARVLDGIGSGESGEVQQAQIDANGLVRVGQFGLCYDLTGKAHVPMLPLALDRGCLDGSLNRSVQLDLDAAQATDRETGAAELPAGCIGKGETVVVRPALIARVARRLPATDPAKEVVKRLLDAAQNILQDVRTESTVLWSDIAFEFWQDVGLIVVGDAILVGVLFAPRGIVEVGMTLARVPRLFALLQGGVIEFTTARKLLSDR